MKGKIGSKICSMFFSHWLLKIISLLLAFALWFVVISTDDPVDERRFQNIKVNLLNTELLTENNQVYEILDNTDVLRTVTFDAPSSVRREIQSSDIIAEADLTNLTVTNTVEIKFSCPKYGDQVQNIRGNIEYVKLNIEEKADKWINIEVIKIGDVASGYMIGGTTLDRNRMHIEGPRSAIDQIDRAMVEVDVAGITSNSTASGEIRLVDADGNEVVRNSVIRNLDAVTISVTVWNIKEIPVVYDYAGTLAENYVDTGEIEASIETVKIAGPADRLINISELQVRPEDVNITGSIEDFETVVHLKDYLPVGIYFADANFNDTARVTVKIEEIKEKTIRLQAENIQIINVPEGMEYQIIGSTSTPLIVRGLEAYTMLLSSSTLQGVVDVSAWMENSNLSELPEGEYSLPVTVSLLSGQEKVATPAITLRFTREQEEDAESNE